MIESIDLDKLINEMEKVKIIFEEVEFYNKFDLNLTEADDYVERLNGESWPDNDEAITKGFKIANDEVLHSVNILYVISWLKHKEIKKFLGAGFKMGNTYVDVLY